MGCELIERRYILHSPGTGGIFRNMNLSASREGVRFALLACLLCVLCSCQSARTVSRQTLAAKLDSILNRQSQTKAIYVARVLELPSRRELYAHDIDTPVKPASNMKLFT